MPFDASLVHAVCFALCLCFWGRATHFFTAGCYAAWVKRNKVGSKDRREDEMFLTNVTTYRVSMHDTMWFCMFAPSPVPIINKLLNPPNFAACRLRRRKESCAIPRKSKIAAPSRMDGSSTQRLYRACCVLHL